MTSMQRVQTFHQLNLFWYMTLVNGPFSPNQMRCVTLYISAFANHPQRIYLTIYLFKIHALCNMYNFILYYLCFNKLLFYFVFLTDQMRKYVISSVVPIIEMGVMKSV